MSDLVGNPEDRFSQNEAHFKVDTNIAKIAQTYRRLSAIMFYLNFFNFLSVIYRWNWNEVFYLLISSDVAYLDCMGIYKAFNFAASPKIEC